MSSMNNSRRSSLESLPKIYSLKSSVVNQETIQEDSNIYADINLNDPPILAFPVPQAKRLLWYNLNKKPAEMTVIRKLPYLFSGIEDDCNLIPWLFLDEDTLFICGGLRR